MFSRLNAGVGRFDRPRHLRARRPVVEQQRRAVGRLGHAPRHREASHVRLVRARQDEGRVEEVKDRHRARRLPLGEARRVLERVDGGAPERDSPPLQPAVELLERVPRLVQQPADPPVHDARHLGAGVDAAEAQERVRPHLRGLSRLRHQPLAEGDHDRVVLGKGARQVPQPLAHHVGADRVRRLLHLVQRRLVLPRSLAEAAEEARSERRGRGGHREASGDAAGRERVRRDGLRLGPLQLHVLQPQVETEKHRPGVEGPLGDEVALVDGLHAPLEGDVGCPFVQYRTSAGGLETVLISRWGGAHPRCTCRVCRDLP